MGATLNEVVVIDAVRTAFGKAVDKGIFWKTRAEDLSVPLLKALIARSPPLSPADIEDGVWGATHQMKAQGGTIGHQHGDACREYPRPISRMYQKDGRPVETPALRLPDPAAHGARRPA